MSNRKKPAAKKVHVAAAKSDRVVVAYIHPGETSAYFTQSLVNLLMYDQATERRIVGCLNEWSSANVSASRNSLVQQFLENYDAEWLLWIDADMAFGHESLPLLLETADAETHPIVGGLCFGMSQGLLFPTIYQFQQTDDGGLTTVRLHDFPDGEVVQCAATGSAFVLIHRRVLEQMRDHGFNAAFPWYQETELAGQPCGEDITFCIRAGILGIPTHVNTAIHIGHHKSQVLDHAMFRAQRQAILAAEGVSASG